MGTDSNTDQLAAYSKEGPPEHGLPAIRRLRALLDEWEEHQVRAARARGWNWGEIGRVLGRSRQAVHARYRDVVERDPLPRPLTAWEIRTKKRECWSRGSPARSAKSDGWCSRRNSTTNYLDRRWGARGG